MSTAGGDLPGTGRGVDGEAEDPKYRVPKGYALHCSYEKRYKKVHSMLSFGYAPTLLTQDHTVNSVSTKFAYVVTSLMDIPVDRPYFYMSPLEYTLLEPGETVKSLRVRVIQRNVRVAFETNASESKLATLNQNKNGCYAVGLNKTGYGFSAHTTAKQSEPMVPYSIGQYTHAFKNVAYGSSSSTAETLGCQGFNVPWAGVNYFVMTREHAGHGQGWPNLHNMIDTYDASMGVNQEIVSYEYKPVLGVLKRNGPPKYYGNPDASIAAVRQSGEPGGVYLMRHASTTFRANRQDVAGAQSFHYAGLIEKCQWMQKGQQGTGNSVQPSLHVGIQAVPAINVATGSMPDAWTDVQAMYDIECEMVTTVEKGIFNQRGQHWDYKWEDNLWQDTSTPLTTTHSMMTFGNKMRADKVYIDAEGSKEQTKTTAKDIDEQSMSEEDTEEG